MVESEVKDGRCQWHCTDTMMKQWQKGASPNFRSVSFLSTSTGRGTVDDPVATKKFYTLTDKYQTKVK